MATPSIETRRTPEGVIFSGPSNLIPSPSDGKLRLVGVYDLPGGKSVTVFEDGGGKCFITTHPKPHRVRR